MVTAHWANASVPSDPEDATRAPREQHGSTAEPHHGDGEVDTLAVVFLVLSLGMTVVMGYGVKANVVAAKEARGREHSSSVESLRSSSAVSAAGALDIIE